MTRPRATVSVLRFRVVAGIGIIGLYAVIRLPLLTSPWEAAATWVGAVLVGGLVLASLEQLALRSCEPDAATEIIPPVREWPGDIELAIAEARHEATHALVDRGEITEHLFTHDVLCEPTPPHGLAMPRLTPGVPGWTSGTITGRLSTNVPFASDDEEHVGRHRAPAHLDRDRFGQLFGQL